MIGNKKEKATVEAKGSIELEEMVRDAIKDEIQAVVSEMSSKYYRDIKVDFDVTVK